MGFLKIYVDRDLVKYYVNHIERGNDLLNMWTILLWQSDLLIYYVNYVDRETSIIKFKLNL